MTAVGTAGSYRRLSQEEADAVCAKHDRLWTARPGGARAVFSWMDLTGLNFRGRNLSDADFTGAILAGCKFVNARLDHTVFFGADLQEADLSEASLRRADLRGACLRGSDLTGADLFEADLREGSIAAVDRGRGLRLLEHTTRVSEAQGATLAGANLERSKLSGVIAVRADFTDAILKDAKLVRANLKQASMSGANLAGADLSGADLSGADLRDAVLVGATIYACNTTDARMDGALTDQPQGRDVSELPYGEMVAAHAQWCETQGREGHPSVFDGADLRALKSIKGYNLTALSAKGAVFYGLDMEGVQLQGAQLQGADLRACNLRRADLRGARLMGAKLSGSDLREAVLGPLLIASDRVMPTDMSRCIAKGADFSHTDIRQAIMVFADLSRSNFTGANLRQADLTGAHRAGVRGLEAPPASAPKPMTAEG
ncbi:MAG TPA: pentapeptide repeat-containing protein [Caulobacteraceae bacterium]|nr:pentapeptide repeat-containing protein [Caulobacteraceae bacterium]